MDAAAPIAVEWLPPRLPPAPAGLAVSREGAGVRVDVAAGSWWRRPGGARFRRLGRLGLTLAGLLVLTAVAVLGLLRDPARVTVAAASIVLLLGSALYGLLVAVGLGVARRGTAGFLLDDQGVTQRFGAGRWREVELFTPWSEAARASGEGEAAAPTDWPGVQTEAYFSDLNGPQARWMERAVRRFGRPDRLAARRAVAGGRGVGEAVEVARRGSTVAWLAIIATLGLCGTAVAWLVPYIVSDGDVKSTRDVIATLITTVILVTLVGSILVRCFWPVARRERLRITSAVVAIERWRLLGGARWRRARLEEVRGVSVDRREVRLALAPRLDGLSRKPLAFRVPAYHRPARLADDLRQLLGLAPTDRGFPVVVRGEGKSP